MRSLEKAPAGLRLPSRWCEDRTAEQHCAAWSADARSGQATGRSNGSSRLWKLGDGIGTIAGFVLKAATLIRLLVKPFMERVVQYLEMSLGRFAGPVNGCRNDYRKRETEDKQCGFVVRLGLA